MKEKELIVLSLFDGMSCGRIALERAGFKVGKYFASEVDKYAIQVSNHNYPNIIQIGDVAKVSYREGVLYTENGEFEVGEIDLVIGGSPCTNLSFSGKQQGLRGETLEEYIELKNSGFDFGKEQSHLFWEYVRILKEVNPTYFLLENVRMKKHWQDVISQTLGVEPIKDDNGKPYINSALLSAQNRVRSYWTNIQGVTQPEDRGIILSDILEGDGDFTDRQKSFCLDANYFKGGNPNQYFNKSRRQLVFSVGRINSSQDGVIVSDEGKSPCLTAGHDNMPKVALYPASIVGRLINDKGVREDYNKNVPITQCLQVKHKAVKSACLTTVGKDNVISFLPPGRYVDAYNKLNENIHWRKLTPEECEKLQTVDPGYTSVVSASQRYRMLGNGWTISVISHIFSFM